MRIFAPIVVTLAATACTPKAPEIVVTEPMVVATPMGGAAYFTIRNRGAGDRLVGVSAPAVGDATIHETVRDGSIMRMRPIDGVDVPAGTDIVFKRGGRHVMLMGKPDALVPGTTVTLTLSFAQSGKIDVAAPVQAIGEPMESM